MKAADIWVSEFQVTLLQEMFLPPSLDSGLTISQDGHGSPCQLQRHPLLQSGPAVWWCDSESFHVYAGGSRLDRLAAVVLSDVLTASVSSMWADKHSICVDLKEPNIRLTSSHIPNSGQGRMRSTQQ